MLTLGVWNLLQSKLCLSQKFDTGSTTSQGSSAASNTYPNTSFWGVVFFVCTEEINLASVSHY